VAGQVSFHTKKVQKVLVAPLITKCGQPLRPIKSIILNVMNEFDDCTPTAIGFKNTGALLQAKSRVK
jgi:hypothetical protein